MSTTVSVYTPEYTGETNLILKIYDSFGVLVNAGGDVLTELQTPGAFQATVEEPLTNNWYLLNVELNNIVVDSTFKFTGQVASDAADPGVTQSTFDSVTQTIASRANGGYEFTGGFTDRTTGTAGVSDVGSNVLYTQDMVDNKRWLRFGFDSTQQATNDVAYWTEPTPQPTTGIGLFGGAYMPENVSSMFDFGFSAPTYSAAVETGDLQYTSAAGSFDFTDCRVGDLALIRFDFNVLPQVANTTLEIALIWQTRLADGTPTFTFALTGEPQYFGTGTVGQTFLARPFISAYFASEEDVNARALLAVRADNLCQIQPLTTLTTIQR